MGLTAVVAVAAAAGAYSIDQSNKQRAAAQDSMDRKEEKQNALLDEAKQKEATLNTRNSQLMRRPQPSIGGGVSTTLTSGLGNSSGYQAGPSKTLLGM